MMEKLWKIHWFFQVMTLRRVQGGWHGASLAKGLLACANLARISYLSQQQSITETIDHILQENKQLISPDIISDIHEEYLPCANLWPPLWEACAMQVFLLLNTLEQNGFENDSSMKRRKVTWCIEEFSNIFNGRATVRQSCEAAQGQHILHCIVPTF